MHGALLVLLADALFVPAGVLTAAFLTRRLGPEGYGIYSLTVSLGMWVEWGILAAFSRATIKFVGESRDWRPIGATALRINTLSGGLAAGAMIAVAGPVAALLGEPALATTLRLYATVMLIVLVSSVHNQILVGKGDFVHRALSSATYSTARMCAVIAFVWLGLGVDGAIVGLGVAAAAGLLVARRFVRPSWRASDFAWQRLWAYALPLFLFSIGQRMLGFLDLVMLKLLGAPTAEIGHYGAAQNVAMALNFAVLAATPLLLSALTRALRDGERARAQSLVVDTFRLVLLVLPLLAVVAGCSGEVLTLVSGAQYLPAAVLVPALAAGSLARSVTMTTSTIQVAIGQPRLPAWSVLPIVPLSLVAQWLIIPRYGSPGAAAVTLAGSVATAALSFLLLQRHWPVALRVSTLVRASILCVPAWWLATWWPATGLAVIAKITVLGAVVLLGYGLLGELDSADRARIRRLVARARRRLTP